VVAVVASLREGLLFGHRRPDGIRPMLGFAAEAFPADAGVAVVEMAFCPYHPFCKPLLFKTS